MEKQKPIKPVKQTKAKDEPKPKQPLKDQINKKAKPYVDKVDTQVRYRYVCPFCTGIAFKSPNTERTQGTTCAVCQRYIPALTKDNYIKLT